MITAFASSPWKLTKVRDVCKDKEPCDPSKSPDGIFDYVDIASVSSESFEVVAPKRLVGSAAPSRARKRIRTGDVLVATTRPYLKSIARVSEALDGQVCSTGFCVLRASEVVLSEWIYLAALSDEFTQQLTAQMRGANYPAVTDRDVLDAYIPLPDVDEQGRIVACVKLCFEREREIAGLIERVRVEADHLPQAFRFDLWEECLARHPLVELDSLVASTKNGLYKPREHHGSGTLLLRMFNINGAEFDASRIERLGVSAKEASDYSIENGDIIVSRVNSRELVGKSTVVVGLTEPAVFEAMLIRLRTDPRQVRQDVLTWLMNSPQFLHQLRMRAKHAIGQSSINQQDLLGCTLPMPPLAEQTRIADRFSDLGGFATSLQDECESRREPAEGLRAAILRKAFAGEL